MYLPKTWPSHPVPTRESAFFSLSDSAMYKTVTLQPVWSLDIGPKAKATSPIVEVSFTDAYVHTHRIAHRTVVVLPIGCHIPFRTILSLEA